MKFDTTYEGVGATFIIEVAEVKAKAAIHDIRVTYAGLIYHRIHVRDTSDGKARIGIVLPSCQTLNDLSLITEQLQLRYTLLSGRFGKWEFQVTPPYLSFMKEQESPA